MAHAWARAGRCSVFSESDVLARQARARYAQLQAGPQVMSSFAGHFARALSSSFQGSDSSCGPLATTAGLRQVPQLLVCSDFESTPT